MCGGRVHSSAVVYENHQYSYKTNVIITGKNRGKKTSGVSMLRATKLTSNNI